MDRFNILVSPDEDFPEVVVAQRMGEGFEREYVEYEPRWRFDRRRRAVVADEKFFYEMADTAERLKAENAKLCELVRILAYCMSEDRDCDRCALNGADMPTPRISACDSLSDIMRELWVEVDR